MLLTYLQQQQQQQRNNNSTRLSKHVINRQPTPAALASGENYGGNGTATRNAAAAWRRRGDVPLQPHHAAGQQRPLSPERPVSRLAAADETLGATAPAVNNKRRRGRSCALAPPQLNFPSAAGASVSSKVGITDFGRYSASRAPHCEKIPTTCAKIVTCRRSGRSPRPSLPHVVGIFSQ